MPRRYERGTRRRRRPSTGQSPDVLVEDDAVLVLEDAVEDEPEESAEDVDEERLSVL